MKYIGFPLGWIFGMILQIIFFPMLIHKDPLTNSNWWIVQLVGLFISILVCLYLDRKVVKAWLSQFDWNKIIEWWKS
jgi:hypothetical protein